MTTVERDEIAPDHADARDRRRRRRPRRTSVLVVVVALVFFFGPAVAYLAGVRASDIDNRSLTKFPSASQGWNALPQLGQWATDHLPGRKQAVRANGSISRQVYREDPNYGTDASGKVAYPRILQGKDDWLYFGGDIGNRCNPKSSVAQVIKSMTRLADAVRSSGRRFVLVVAPDKSTIYPQHLPSTFAGKRCLAQVNDQFWPQLRAAAARVSAVDLRAALESRARQTGLLTYRPHDTHFSAFGASVYAQQIAAALDARLAEGTTVPPGPDVDAQGDLSLLSGHPVKDRIPSYHVTRAGVTPSPGSDPELRYTLTHVRNGSTSAPLYANPTILLGDSFTATSRNQIIPYFADLEMMHSEMSTKEPHVIANYLVDRGTVVYEIVERSASTGLAGLLSPVSIKAIRETLAAHPYHR